MESRIAGFRQDDYNGTTDSHDYTHHAAIRNPAPHCPGGDGLVLGLASGGRRFGSRGARPDRRRFPAPGHAAGAHPIRPAGHGAPVRCQHPADLQVRLGVRRHLPGRKSGRRGHVGRQPEEVHRRPEGGRGRSGPCGPQRRPGPQVRGGGRGCRRGGRIRGGRSQRSRRADHAGVGAPGSGRGPRAGDRGRRHRRRPRHGRRSGARGRGVQVGTRFAASLESAAHPAFKAAIRGGHRYRHGAGPEGGPGPAAEKRLRPAGTGARGGRRRS